MSADSATSDDLFYFVYDDRFDDLSAILFSLGKRLREMERLFGVDVSRQRRLIGIDDSLNERRAVMLKSFAKDVFSVFWIFDGESGDTAAVGNFSEVDRLQFHSVFRVGIEHHLLPLDLSQRIVLNDDDLDLQ